MVLFSIEKGRFARANANLKPSAILQPSTAVYQDNGWAEEDEEELAY